MKKEQLSRLINSHKRVDTIETPKKKRLSVTLWKYTGRSIVKTIETYMSDLKNDLDIVFKPVKNFSKKHLKGAEASKNLSANLVTENDEVVRGTPTLHSPTPKDEFINWFDVGNQEKPNSENTKCTYTDKYGNTVSLDESYESLKRDD